MTHIPIVEQLNGKAVDWLEHASDGEYLGESVLEGSRRTESSG
jgi:hypothetical protein